nr:MAG TPA: hypothetical protein [Caudoviricetes sp.]
MPIQSYTRAGARPERLDTLKHKGKKNFSKKLLTIHEKCDTISTSQAGKHFTGLNRKACQFVPVKRDGKIFLDIP